MHSPRSFKFWIVYVALLVPSLFVCALPGVLLIGEGTAAWKAAGILIGQELIAFSAPWVIARSIVRQGSTRGFSVIEKRADGDKPRSPK